MTDNDAPRDERLVDPLLEEIRRLRLQIENMRSRIRECDRCEINLAETNARLKAFLESAHELVCFLDGDGRLLSASQTFLEFYRLQDQPIRGKSFLELAPLSDFHKNAFVRAARWEQKAWDSGHSVTCEDIIQTPEGGDRLFEITRTPLFYENGERKGMVLVGMDVTERVKREFEAQLLMAEQAAIFENALVGILYTRDNRIVRVNHTLETMFGFGRDELVGRPTDSLTSSDVRQEVLEQAGQALERGEVYSAEVLLSRKDGRRFFGRISGKPIPSEDGLGGVIWLVDDIDEQMRIQRQREDTERLMRHDLKTPLQSILGAADLLAEQELDENCRRFIRIIASGGERLLETIENSLDLFRMEEGLYQLRPEKLDLLRLLGEKALEFEASLRAKDLELRLDFGGARFEGASCFVAGESRHLSIMFGNLIKNAVEASPHGEAVGVSVNETPEAVSVAIRNAGAIPEEIRGRFFERYATSGKAHGTGLGAYSARLIARVHGGDIDVDAEEDSVTLLVTLPRG